MVNDYKKESNLADKDAYYKDTLFASFSAIKVFSKCETLYRDMYITKTYEEPEKDYFVYGKLVDAMVTESDEFVRENFVLVERKVNPEDALKIENNIKELESQIKDAETKINQQKESKAAPLREKIKEISEKIDAERKKNKDFDPVPLLEKQMDISKKVDAIEPNKVLAKGIESRLKAIDEEKIKLNRIKEFSDKQQVTAAVWRNAEETALAIKTHPYYSNMEFNQVTSQQIFVSVIDGIPCKGRLDHLKLSPTLTKLYSIYIANQMTLDELQAKIRELNPNDLWAVITDIKTCYSIQKLEPYNNHYRGQLGFYQDLVSSVLLIPKEKITLQAFAADKVSGTFKMAELFRYTQRAIDELKPDVKEWARLWQQATKNNAYISAKRKHGMNQKCFTCSECRIAPFSINPGEAVIVDAPRFSVAPDLGNPNPNGYEEPESFTVDASLEN